MIGTSGRQNSISMKLKFLLFDWKLFLNARVPCFYGRGRHLRVCKWIHMQTREGFTLPETDIAPENGWLEVDFPFGKAYFHVLC